MISKGPAGCRINRDFAWPRRGAGPRATLDFGGRARLSSEAGSIWYTSPNGDVVTVPSLRTGVHINHSLKLPVRSPSDAVRDGSRHPAAATQ